MKKEDLHVEIKEPDYYDSPLELVSVEEMITKLKTLRSKK